MNCKPGDLAVIVRLRPENSHLLGQLVEVVSTPPRGVFRLPDQRLHDPVSDGSWWVIKFLAPVDLKCIRGGSRSRYAAIQDSALRPIRDPGEDAQDETLSWLPVPEKEGVEA